MLHMYHFKLLRRITNINKFIGGKHMNREELETRLNDQQRADYPLKGEKYQEAQQLIDSIIAVRAKIKMLESSLTNDKTKLKSIMIESGIDELYSYNGKSTLSISDVVRVDSEKVRAVANEFAMGTRDNMTIDDVTVLSSQQTFRVSELKLGDNNE